MNIPIPDCKKFTGYKPCYPDHDCWVNGCKDSKPFGTKILIINLDAMGDVLMTTAQLPAIKRKFPDATIWWVTLPRTVPLLENNPYIHKAFGYDFETLSILSGMEFDYVMNVDKSQRSGVLATTVNAKHRLGFGINSSGQIIPFNEKSSYNYELGTNDHLKFKINQVTGQEYLAETFELDFQNDEYVFEFTEEEKQFTANYRKEVGLTDKDFVVGFNTGCSYLYPNKKMTIEQHVYLIGKLLEWGKCKIVLLGGPEDEQRNEEIYSHFAGKIISTPTKLSIRRGACFANLPNLTITGDSYGMHLSIAVKKYILVWFGVSCWTEIGLYNRGVKFFQKDLECSPCWKKTCPYDLECMKMLDLDLIIEEVKKYHSTKFLKS